MEDRLIVVVLYGNEVSFGEEAKSSSKQHCLHQFSHLPSGEDRDAT